MARRDYRPGEHGKVPHKVSDYGRQLREKQKVKKIYGILERQFRRYIRTAERSRGMTGENLLLLLERRFDNIIFRSGFAMTRAAARQLIRHGHFLINNRIVNIPSYSCKVGDEISLKVKGVEVVERALKLSQDREKAPWLEVDSENLKGKVIRFPKREEIGLPVQEQLIVEYYSR
jgi:small subunit ribosomal protein S4